MSENTISHALDFPQGRFIIIPQKFNQPDSIYFIPKHNDSKAYLLYGTSTKVFSINIEQVLTKDGTTEKDYALSYEINDDKLVYARLVSDDVNFNGVATNPAIVDQLNLALQNNDLELVGRLNKPEVMRVLDIGNGQTIVVCENYTAETRFTIFVGTPGNYQRFDPDGYMQGGNSFFFDDIGNGKNLELPWSVGGPNPNEAPVYGGQKVHYAYGQEIFDMRYDFEKFGLKAPLRTHFGPFTPMPPKAPALKPGAKPFGR